MNSKLPNGYCAGPLTEAYEQGAVDVMNKHYRWLNGSGNFTSLEESRLEWGEESFKRETDALVIVSPQDEVVGYIDFWDVSKLHVRTFGFAAVDPNHMGCGIGTYMAQWLVERARKNISLAPEGARVVLHQSLDHRAEAAKDLLARHGFQEVRHFYTMRIELDAAPPAPVVPDGIVIRPMKAGQEEREAIRTRYDAFRDHWGSIDEPFDDYFKRWLYYMEKDPNYDPTLYFVAMDGDEMAGVALCHPRTEEDSGMGWVSTLAVRRAYRKRGLGLALLRHSFGEFYRRGTQRAALGVDAANLTGAVRLYERAGMHIWRKQCTYEYELRPGKDLMHQG